jgi:nitroreductase
MSGRRSVLLFSPELVPLELIENAIRCASLAPSGANQHPWRLVAVQDADIKHKIREAAESGRMAGGAGSAWYGLAQGVS